MKCDAHDSPAFVAASTRYASFASTINASVWSYEPSQSSDERVFVCTSASDAASCDAFAHARPTSGPGPASGFGSGPGSGRIDNAAAFRRPSVHCEPDAVPSELRQNPRRTASGSLARAGRPPALVRQSDRKVNFVDSLVDSSTQIVEAIWPLSAAICRADLGGRAVLPLRTFIQETLRRSRTSYSTLQVALYYLVLVKPHVPKHNFTMEQPADRHADRALQCGRRMFLAALILASKYLQDRNYSARAWSKISGLNTHEINQNEIAFLLAVDWKLHIADDVFQRWTDIVLRYTPPPGPPSPGGPAFDYVRQADDWKHVILRLDPGLTNIDGLAPLRLPTPPARASDLSVLSPRSILNLPQEARQGFGFGFGFGPDAAGAVPAARACNAPAYMEPTAYPKYNLSRPPPLFGFLPTPRLTPQASGLCTPAASAAPHMVAKGGAMGLAVAQASCVATAQSLDRLPCSVTSSPQGLYPPTRRSSLANSVSTASSPESMVSDSSRSSSISSASSLPSATVYSGSSSRCSVPSRFRVSRLWSDRMRVKPTVPSVPEDCDENCQSSSPDSYTGPVAGLGKLSLDTSLARREREMDKTARDAASDAARALQDLHNHAVSADATPVARTGSKRVRTGSVDNALQDNVREMLSGRCPSEAAWPETLVRSDKMTEPCLQFAVRPTLGGSGKRVCCSAEAASGYAAAMMHPALSLREPMWDGILN